MMNNTLKTFLLLASLSALLLVMGQVLGGTSGLAIALVFALVMNIGAYWYSDSLVLRLSRARPLEPGEAPWLQQSVQVLARRAGIPTPRLYVVDDPTPNAFATGRNPEKGVVAVHTGLLQILDRREIEGVLAHEIGHIVNRDTLISAIAATMAGAIGALADMAFWSSIFGGFQDEEEGSGLGGLLLMFLAPLMAGLIQMAVSRSRELKADAVAARLTGRPLDLAHALARLEKGTDLAFRSGLRQASPATAHLMIVNPLRGGNFQSLFSTHPSTALRIQRLQEMARQMPIAA